ncbi:MAG: ISAs1 family transposase [Planctomycetes bacterium]|nr:ISAs1 family transposase [Planctomycetota bacterium]
MGIFSGATGPEGIADWANAKEELLNRCLDLSKGIPQKRVYRRVLIVLNPEAFELCFMDWLKSFRKRAIQITGIDQPVIAIDGKTVRRNHDHKKGLRPFSV